MKTLIFSFLFLFSAIGPGISAQERSLVYTATDDSYVEIRGTSTLHDWQMRSETIESRVVFRGDNGQQPESFEFVEFELRKTTLEADQSRLRNMALDEMEADEHPHITFRSLQAGSLVANGDSYTVTTTGELTIAGVTRNVSVEAECNSKGELLVCSGSEQLLMTDFDMDPPRLFLGTLRTDDQVTVEFNIIYQYRPDLEAASRW